MARKFVVSLDLNKNELLNARIQNLSSAPSSPVAGQIYYNTSTNVLYFYNGSEWTPTSGSTEVIQDVIGSSVSGGTGLTATYNDSAGTTTIDLDDTTVTAGDYGSSTAIPTFTVDAQGRLTAAGEETISTDLAISADSGTGTISLLSETLQVSGGEGIDTSVSNNTITIAAEDATSVNKGIASFDSTDFTVTSGSVTLNAERVQDIVGSQILGGTGIDATYTDSAGTLSIDIDSTVATLSDTQTFTNKTISDNLTFNDGSNSSTVGATGNDLIITANDDLTLNASNGDINLNPDGQVVVDGTVKASGIVTQHVYGSVEAGDLTLSDNANLSQIHINSTTKNIELLPDASAKAFYGSAATAGNEIAKKSDLQALSSGLDWKEAVNLLSTSNIADLTDFTTITIDGHVVDVDQIGYRILLTGQSTATENGIYQVVAATGSNITLSRSADADTNDELKGAAVFVMEGTQYGSTSWVQSNHYIADFANQDWIQFSGQGTYIGSDSIQVDGNQINALVNTDKGLAIDGDGIKTVLGEGLVFSNSGAVTLNPGTGFDIATGYLNFAESYGVRKFSQSVGDENATSFTLTHNFSTRDVTVHIYDNSSPYAQIEADVEHTSTSVVTVKFAVAPDIDQYRVVIVG